MSIKKSLMWIIFWVALAMAFNVFIYFFMGEGKALEFLGGYIIEQSLSLDNLFLFLLIFEEFAIPSIYQRRVLNYGIIGAVVLRLIFIVLGVAIISKFHWILYIFGAVLIISGIKMFFQGEENENVKESPIIKTFSKIMPVSEKLHEEKFFVRIDKNTLCYSIACNTCAYRIF